MLQRNIFISVIILSLITSLYSCTRRNQQSILISEDIEKLNIKGIQKEYHLSGEQKEVSATCLFNNQMNFEKVSCRLELIKGENKIIISDTLDFILSKKRGLWMDKKIILHEVQAKQQMMLELPSDTLYTFRIKLLTPKEALGIIGFILDIK